MSWKKNAFSYLMWFVYSLAASVCFICLAIYLLRGYGGAVGLLAGGGLLAVLGLSVFLIHRLWTGGRSARSSGDIPGAGMTLLVAESLSVVLLLVAGVLLRIFLMPEQTGESPYYEAAKVAEGQMIPQIVHGTVYFYIWLLHFVCIVFGNKITACIISQIVLQVLAFLLLYLASRKTAGRLAAMLSLVFFLFVPEMIAASWKLSPEILQLFFFAAGLAFAAGLSETGSLTGFLAAGVLTGIVLYLDIIGILLLVFTVFILFEGSQQQEKAVLAGKGRGKRLLLCASGMAAGFLAAIALDALWSGKEMARVLSAWCQVFVPEKFRLTGIGLAAEGAGAVILLICLASGIFSFWCRNDREKMSVWICQLLLLGLAYCFGMTGEEAPGGLLLACLLVLPAAVGVQEIFAVKAPGAVLCPESDVTAGVALAAQAEREEQSRSAVSTEDDLQEIRLEGLPGRAPAKKKIEYIENPLPLPKKHEKKVMDYRVKEPDKDDFDFAVSADDDFDI